jgi:hypothetical protein
VQVQLSAVHQQQLAIVHDGNIANDGKTQTDTVAM